MTQEQKEQAAKLKRLGHKYSEIAKKLKVDYHVVYLFLHGKSPVKCRTEIEENLYQKMLRFCRTQVTKKKTKYTQDFTIQELLNKIGPNPQCYLTGEAIDLTKPETYSLDHIIPRSKGGDNSLSNCGLATREVNQAKSDLTPEEFKALCMKVINH